MNGIIRFNGEHFSPLLEQISILEEDLYKIIFEQHWLQANTDRQALGMIQKKKDALWINQMISIKLAGVYGLCSE